MRKREQQQARRRERAQTDTDEVSPEVLQLALQVQQACEARDIPQLMDLYPAALDAGFLDQKYTHVICQALHARMRRSAARKDRSKPSDLLPFIQQIVSDLQRGALPPHPYAYVHLLGMYKDLKHFEEGRALWLWLTEQDESHVSQAAYGAAIELMASGRLMPLHELEELYEEGLQRFPGTYAEYHLSPDAIVPDRAQPVHIVGLPITLLQGIITARLLLQDWKKAYLGLDTILRLYPGQTPHRIFELFITERPEPEAYTAFLLACRSGTQISGGQVTKLLNRLRVIMTQSPVQSHRFTILRAIANALYAYQQSGAPLSSVHVGQFIKSFEFLLPEKAPGQDFTGEETEHCNSIAMAAHESLSRMLQSGLSPEIHPFVSLVSLAGKVRSPDLLRATIEDAKNAGITFGPVERRNLLTSAGLVKDRNMIKIIWSLVVAGAEKEGVQISYNDWITFARACRRADYVDYFEEQLHEQAHALTDAIEQRARLAATNPEPAEAHSSFELMPSEQLNLKTKDLRECMDNICAVLMSGQPLNPKHSPFNMHIDPRRSPLGSKEELRAIYDEFTTDPHQPSAAADASPDVPVNDSPKPTPAALSKTGIPLDELRFQNWVSVHEMMASARAFEASGELVLVEGLTNTEATKQPTNLHTHIKELRTPVPIFRKTGSSIPTEKYKPMSHMTETDAWRTINVVKHTAKSFHKEETTMPPALFEPKKIDPQMSRWVPRKITKTYSDAVYDPAVVRSKFVAYGDNAPAEVVQGGAGREEVSMPEEHVAKPSTGESA